MNAEPQLIEIEVDESMLTGWRISPGPGGTARFVNTLEAAAADRETRGFTLKEYVTALNEAADREALPFNFTAHTQSFNGAGPHGDDATARADEITGLMLRVEEQLRR